MAGLPIYPWCRYGFCWGMNPWTHTPTPAKPINLPQGFPYLCHSLPPTKQQHSQHLQGDSQYIVWAHHGVLRLSTWHHDGIRPLLSSRRGFIKRMKRGTYSHSTKKSHILYFFSCFFPSMYKNFKNTHWGQSPLKNKLATLWKYG